MSIDNMSSIFIRPDTVTAEINDKCYQRWHQVLQEGLVPMSVHALNLLEKTATSGGETLDDEEEAYFATMEGMEEEIQVMAILARAAALNDLPASYGGKECADDNKNSTESSDVMEQINGMMKCTAMLLFHIVLAATPGSSSGSIEETIAEAEATKNDSSAQTTKTVAGYDGRVRHVMKLACVDILTHAIVESVESFDNNNSSIATDEKDQSSGLHDMGEYSLWNIANIKTFLDQTDLGKDAIFGTPFKPSSGVNESVGGKKLMDAGEEKQIQKKTEKRQFQSEIDEQTMNSGDMSKGSQSEANNDQISNSREMPHSDSSFSLEDQLEQIMKDTETKSLEENPQKKDDHDDVDDNVSNHSNQSKEEQGNEEQESDTKVEGDRVQQGGDGIVDSNHSKEEQEPETNNEEQQDEDVQELHARRQFNAKFLATRKFELIERLVAIDIVRFLMAEERENKLREKELKERKNKANMFSSLLKKGNDHVQDSNNEDGTNSNHDENVDTSSEQITNTTSQYFTASRLKQIKRGAKIAGAGLALGTVFAITGGLAAPALAAGIGGIAALTGASTASSAALLAVLATFKAGAALFGMGGGGLAAYKMKKRTAGLSQFEITRENVEQYMFDGASDEQMRKGIEAMLPQLHTTVCVAGFLRHNDVADFQLAWGIQPTCKYEDADDHQRRIRQMRRFYAVYNPPLVHLCERFMQTLQKKLKKGFSWDRIWNSLEQKYGANPDHLIPLDTPYDNEVFLSYEEKGMINGVLNDAKIVNLRKRGSGAGDGIDFNENDEIAELLAKVSPKKLPRKDTNVSETEHELDTIENHLVAAMKSDLALDGNDQFDDKKTDTVIKEIEMKTLSVRVPSDDGTGETSEKSLQERMVEQREQQVSFLKNKGLLDDESNLREGAGSPKMAGSNSALRDDIHDPPVKNKEIEEGYGDESCPIVWDWKRLYGTADIHTVTWESEMLSSLCHIVENMAIESVTQATKVALQYSVIGAIISAVAIPSALITASKLIDDPYQIIVMRADEAGKELAKCLLLSDERRPVTLVGFSFGARVVYSCLRELARQQDIWEGNRVSASNSTAEENKSSQSSFLPKKNKEECLFEYDREPASLVGDVIFIGLPRAIDKKVLTSCRRVTGGRLVNCYTTNDWLLSLMFVARGGTPCGTKSIKDVPGVENYDVTSMVESHTKYGDAIPYILQHVRFSEP